MLFADAWRGTDLTTWRWLSCTSVVAAKQKRAMHEIIYLIGLVVVVMFVLGLIGVR